MALARIITHSQACSRELALDLLARGYAVEIISPDSIPNDIADLELRVATGPGDQLIASVEAHNGERTASLEFLHQLKSPMADFIRRPPEPRESAHSPKEPVSFHAVPNVEAVELPAEAPQPAPNAVSPAADVLPAPELDREEGARLISPPEPLPSVPVEPPISCAVEASTIAQPTLVEPTTVQPTTVEATLVEPREKPQPPDRPTGWRWRAALIFASVVLLALVLGFGMRRSGKAPAQNSGAVSAQKIAAASSDVNLLSAADPQKNTGKAPGQVATPAPPPAIRSQGNSDFAPEESPVAKTDTAAAAAATPAASTRARVSGRVSRRHGDDLIAPDTVTYLDKHAAENAAARAKRGVAANTVTYLSNPSAPKAAKPNSGVKHPSNLN